MAEKVYGNSTYQVLAAGVCHKHFVRAGIRKFSQTKTEGQLKQNVRSPMRINSGKDDGPSQVLLSKDTESEGIIITYGLCDLADPSFNHAAER